VGLAEGIVETEGETLGLSVIGRTQLMSHALQSPPLVVPRQDSHCSREAAPSHASLQLFNKQSAQSMQWPLTMSDAEQSASVGDADGPAVTEGVAVGLLENTPIQVL